MDFIFHVPDDPSKKPFFSNLFRIADTGAAIHMLPDGIRLLLDPLTKISPLFEANFFILVPRKLAISPLAFVIKVFSSDSVSLRGSRKPRAQESSYILLNL